MGLWETMTALQSLVGSGLTIAYPIVCPGSMVQDHCMYRILPSKRPHPFFDDPMVRVYTNNFSV